MNSETELATTVPWVQIAAQDADWEAAEPKLLRSMFSQLVLIRAFEEYVLSMAAEGLVHGPAHSSIGQEGGAVGSIISMNSADTVNGSHRGHHQFLAKALTHVAPNGIDPAEDLADEVVIVLERSLAEICGLARGFCRGRGGSMHLRWREAGAMGTNAIVGGAVPQALGFAFCHRRAGTQAVSTSYFGDGAINIGSVLESFNLAAAWALPVCFFVENNQYAVSTSVSESTAETRLSARGPGFGIPSWRVDGMDPLAVHLAMTQAIEHMRAGGGPTLIEANTYRFLHQNGPFPGSAFGYRSKQEENSWRERDPLTLTAGHLTRRGILTDGQVENAIARANETMNRIGAKLTEQIPDGKPGRRRIRESEWPDTSFVNVGILGDLSEFEDINTTDRETFSGEIAERSFIEVVAEVMGAAMDLDDRVVVLGEDVHRLAGGPNGATRGLPEKFPGRVLGTPISENAFVGMAGGMSLDGRFRPVVELMYADFLWVAADQLFNQIGKARHMFGGDSSVPIVLRAKVGTGTGYGSQHSMDPAGIFATSPGWRIAAPATPFDYVGLVNTALRCEDPVLIIEHVELYGTSGEGPVDDLTYCVPIGKARVRREGDGITVLTYLSMVNHALAAAAEVPEARAEVIDLRWLDRASLDWETVTASIRKTNNVLIVEQGPVGTSYGGWLSDEIGRRLFDWLDQPVQRVTGSVSSPSISKVLERAAIAKTEEVADALRRHNSY